MYAILNVPNMQHSSRAATEEHQTEKKPNLFAGIRPRQKFKIPGPLPPKESLFTKTCVLLHHVLLGVWLYSDHPGCPQVVN